MIVTVTVMYSFVAFFARRLSDAGLAPASVALHRYLLTAIIMVGFVRLDREVRGATLWGLGSGVAMGVGWMAYAQAVATIDVAAVSLVYMTYPLFAMAGARVLFGVVPARRSLIGGALIVVAAGIVLSPSSIGGGSGPLLVAAIAPLTFGVSIAVLTERLGPLDAFERIGAVTTGAVLGLAVPVLRLPVDEVVPSGASEWTLTIGMGIVATLVPMTLYAIAAPSVGAARSAMTGAVELPVLFLIAAVAFGESLTVARLLAGALIVGAIGLTPTRTPPTAVAGVGDPGDSGGAQDGSRSGR